MRYKDLIFFCFISLLFCSQIIYSQDNLTDSSIQVLSNPSDSIEKNKEKLNEGKVLYYKHCKSCHGKRGKGDGPKAADMDISFGDFTKKEFKEKSRKEIVEIINSGKDEMPSFNKKIDSEEILLIMTYIFTLEDKKEKMIKKKEEGVK